MSRHVQLSSNQSRSEDSDEDDEDDDDEEDIHSLIDWEAITDKKQKREQENEYSRVIAWLPMWARPPKVMTLALEAQEKGTLVPLGVVAGQAIPMVVAATIARVLFQISLVVLTAKMATCDNALGTASYTWHVWPPVASFQLLFCAVEVYAFTYVVIPKLQVLGKPTWMCGCDKSFSWWLTAMSCLSLAASMDFTTDSLFLGVQSKARSCVAGPLINAKWQAFYRETLWYRWFGYFPHIPYFEICLIAYASNFVPVIFVMLFSIVPPFDNCYDEQVSHEAPWSLETEKLGSIDVANGKLERTQTTWKFKKDTFGCGCCLRQRQHNHGEALMGLAEANGMKLVVNKDLTFARTKAELAFCDFIKRFDNDGEMTGPALAFLQATLDHINSQVRRGVLHLFFCGFVSNGYQAVLQIALLAMTKGSQSYTRKDFQLALSFGFSIFSLFLRLLSACEIAWVAREWRSRFHKLFNMPSIDIDDPELTNRYRRLNVWFGLLLLSLVLCIGQLVHILIQFVGLRCPHSAFEVHGFHCWRHDSVYTNQCESILNQTATQQPPGFDKVSLYQAWCA